MVVKRLLVKEIAVCNSIAVIKMYLQYCRHQRHVHNRLLLGDQNILYFERC